MYYIISHCHYCLMMVIAICAAPTCRTCRKSLRTFTMRTSARSASNGAAGCPPMVTFYLCRLRTYCFACFSPPPPSASMKEQSFVSVVTDYLNIPELAAASRCFEIAQLYIVTSHFFLLKTHINGHLIAEIEGEKQRCFA